MAADLELGLIWDHDQENFEVSLRLIAPGLDQMAPPGRSSVKIDADELGALEYDEPAYGARLSEMLFAEPKIKEFREKALLLARDDDVHLRIHIHGPARYQGLRWESLRAPGEDGLPLATARNLWFSRYLSSLDWQPIQLRTRPERRALVVIGAPANLREDYGLPEVDLQAEKERATAALAGYQVDVLGGGGQASLGRIFEQFETHKYEVLYLVAHGRLVDDEPHLVLETPEGTYARVDGLRLAERINGLRRPPTLAMLLSCQSANAGDTVPLAGLGPRLSAAGIPAVIAMQGDVTMETAREFASAFFKSFKETPIVDRAMAKARMLVRDNRDWWAPVLFSRLRSGHAYQDEAFTPPNHIWEDFCTLMEAGEITPVLGPGLTDGILGSRAEIAERWVTRWQMPIVAHGRGNLAQVAQYLRVLGRAPRTVQTYLRKYLMSDIHERVEIATQGDPFHELPSETLKGIDPLPALMEAGRRRREANKDDPYRVAAALPAKVFFTSGWTDLLQEAMRAHGKKPRTLVFPWYPSARWTDLSNDDVFEWDPPTVDSPWILQLFGRLDKLGSLVLTEDDYFAWLSAWMEKRPMLSEHLSEFAKALVENSLLFVGYQLRDWDFQVVFRSIQSFGGADLLLQRQHIGVQLMPELDVIEPEAAQRYLKSYLKNSNVEIFWNDAESFLAELRAQTGLQT